MEPTTGRIGMLLAGESKVHRGRRSAHSANGCRDRNSLRASVRRSSVILPRLQQRGSSSPTCCSRCSLPQFTGEGEAAAP